MPQYPRLPGSARAVDWNVHPRRSNRPRFKQSQVRKVSTSSSSSIPWPFEEDEDEPLVRWRFWLLSSLITSGTCIRVQSGPLPGFAPIFAIDTRALGFYKETGQWSCFIRVPVHESSSCRSALQNRHRPCRDPRSGWGTHRADGDRSHPQRKRMLSMKIGIIELIEETASKSWTDFAYRAFFKKYHASIIPQAVAVWCRQLGHQVWYSTYYGQRDPVSLLPDELDVVFVASYTQASALAYALAKVYRMRKTLTVIGGPHAKAFPKDCLRFFDLAVKDCDKTLIDEILRGSFERHTVVSSGRPLKEIPSVEERMPEIK